MNDTSRLRILYVINDLGVGGAQRALISQATGVAASSHDVHVASLELIPDGKLAPVLENVRIPVYRLRAAGEPVASSVHRLARLVARLRPDIVHTHLAAAGVLGRVTARLFRVPRVLTTLHNLSDWEQQIKNPIRWLDRRTLPLCDRVVAVSEAVRASLARREPAILRRTIVVYNGVAVERLGGASDERRTSRARLGFAESAFVVGTVARLHVHKGVDTLLEAAALAAASCPDVTVLIVGDGPERGRLEALATRFEIADRVRFVGMQLDVRPFLASLDVFMAPSRTEGLGVSIVEALAAGVPAFGARVGGIPEVIQDGVSGRLLPPDQPEEWARTLVHYARRPEELASLAEGARRRAQAFSLGRSVSDLLRAYEDLMAPPAAGHAEAA